MVYKQETFIAHKSLRLEGQGQGAAWSHEGPCPGISLLALSSCGGRGKGALWSVFHKGTNTFVCLFVPHGFQNLSSPTRDGTGIEPQPQQ